jgi:hypothetical protein
MNMIYLLTNKRAIQLVENKKYSAFYNKGFYQVSSELLYITGEAMREGGLFKVAPPKDCTVAFQLANGVNEFDDFYDAWLADSAMWYRGLNCSHFSYADLRKGMMFSEGEEDIPTFTMGNEKKTRWLPGCLHRTLCEGVSFSGTDQFTSALSVAEKTFPIPVGITVRVRLGQNIKVPVAWLNPGEQLIRGPIGAPIFEVCSMAWLRSGNPENTAWGLEYKFLPPPRPYKPTDKQIQTWWAGCEEWRDSIIKVGALVFVNRVKGG